MNDELLNILQQLNMTLERIDEDLRDISIGIGALKGSTA